ncbi:hypothetical protein Acr_00g0044130 [Actinidia rufa]|uniref:Uncharacterized protein n=1 Tax=Actinidia rufa TaxID=165716 RepID=A0A7J0DKK6_9ERIC|nr:hypothetical protein Acr_00g0044130 [Actinidia rufa]
MSKKTDVKKLAQMAKGKGEPKGATLTAKGVVIDAKKKGLMPPPEDKKKGPTTKAPIKSKATLSQAAIPVAALGEGTSANPRAALRLNAFVMENPGLAEKLI